jgi:hypothetical protein
VSGTVASYGFLSWMRRGVVSEIPTPDPLTGALPYRAKLPVKLRVDSSRDGAGQTSDDVSVNIELYGPGDVLGIDPRHIIRSDPKDGALTFEPNYFATIEFHHPDFPWLFSVAAPKAESTQPSGVRPWLVLVVLADGEFIGPETVEPLPKITVADAKSLPNLDDSWAWAHTQVAGGLGPNGAGALAEIARTQPERLLSRLVCPRRLSPDTHYTGFLVPAFEAGRLAGLKKDVPTTDTPPAWAAGATNVELPVYHSFGFRTATEGDFESLVARLEPRTMPDTVGIRDMRVTDVGWNVPDATAVLGLPGALRAPDSTDTPWVNPERYDFQEALGGLVNERSDPRADDPNDPDPVVVPPIYGRWHAARKSVNPSQGGWLNELNLDPRTRVAAGLGTRVVLDQVSQLTASAWKQVQGVIEANARLKQAQMAREAMKSVHRKHLKNADETDAVILTGAMHSKVTASPRTVRAVIAESRLPARALSPTFRRITRPLGPLQRRLGAAAISPSALLRALNSGALSPAPPYKPPAGLVTLEQTSPGPSCPTWVPSWLKPWLKGIALALAVLAAVVVVVFALVGPWWAGVVIGAVLLALAVLAWLLSQRCTPGAAGGRGIDLGDLNNPDAVAAVPPQPGFHLDGSPAPTGVPAGSDSPEAAGFRTAVSRLAEAIKPTEFEPPEKEPADLGGLSGALLEGLDPEFTVTARTVSIVLVTDVLGWHPPEDDPIEPIMAAPEFPQPMYEPLRDISQDLLLPGLDAVPPDTVSLLDEERTFIEAYMVGLNHEMGRQLLWNDYPTDQRGSYFRQFWDVRGYIRTPADPTDPDELKEKLKDIPEIHRWSQSSHLGDHPNRPETGTGRLVLIVRGELLRRYPHADVYACRAVIDTNDKESLGEEERHPLFRGTLAPDITFFGFALDEETARGTYGDPNDPGWFFVFQPQAWEPRFGLEPAPDTFPANPGTVGEWNDLAWTNFATDQASLDALEYAPATTGPHQVAIQEDPNQNPGDDDNAWGLDSAQTAFITLRRPVRVGIHARSMLP